MALKKTKSIKVAIVMGSESDLRVMSEAKEALDQMGVSSEIQILSAHRTPEEMIAFAKAAQSVGFQVIIAGAGGAAHLPGMIASLTTLPVIGVPVNMTSFEGVDALLSIAQMPKGVPVATVAVDNAFNAGLLAARILGLADSQVSQKLTEFQKLAHSRVLATNLKVKKLNRH